MMKTDDLISKLASTAKPVKPLCKPSYWIARLSLFALFYYVIAQTFIGVRSDIAQKFLDPFFVIEIALMLSLLLSCLIASVLTIYPDNYQKPWLLKTPYFVLLALGVFFAAEFFLQNHSELIVLSDHKFKCTLCIACFTAVPSLYFFYTLRKGINLNPQKAGIFATLTAASLSSLVLRIQEQNDLLSHLLIWHYLPFLIFALIGALAGKKVFKW